MRWFVGMVIDNSMKTPAS